MKILFMGTPDFAVVPLRALVESGEDIVGVITQTDKPKGRGMTLLPPPVKIFAAERGIPVYQPKTLRDDAFAALLAELDPELIVVVAFGKLLPENVLAYPKHGCINAHGSLLPKYRGAAPMQRAIMDGETETGVCAMYMESGLDTGDVILTERVPIGETDNFETVHDAMAEAAACAMLRAVAEIKAGTVTRTKQNDALATYAQKIEKADCRIDFNRPAKAIRDQIRALSPTPLAYTTLNGKLLKIISADAEISPTTAPAGTVLSLADGKIQVACSDGSIAITALLPEGKSRMPAAAFIQGRKIREGDLLI